MRAINWNLYPNFKEEEFRCHHTGRVEMDPGFLDRLQGLRTEYGRPMTVSSGYRHVSHPIEMQKPRPGTHTLGCAADIAVSHADALLLIELAIRHGFTGIGVQQKGNSRFIHLDDATPSATRPRPTVWSY